MTVTPRRLVYDAYRQLGVLRPGQMVGDDATDDALRMLGEITDSWQLERLLVYAVAPVRYPLPSAGGLFTFGPGGTLGETAPLRVEGASLEGTVSGGAQPLEVLSWQRWAAGTSGVYLDGRYPLTTLYLAPPASGGETLVLQQWQTFGGFGGSCGADTPLSLAPGYAQALRWNLACALIPSALIQAKIPAVLHQYIEQQATASKAVIKSYHSSPPPELDGSDGGALACCPGSGLSGCGC